MRVWKLDIGHWKLFNMQLRHFEAFYPPETREREIEKLLQFAKEGNSGQLIGIPGSGRSNVFGLLSYNRSVREKHLGEIQKWYHFVYVNLSEEREIHIL